MNDQMKKPRGRPRPPETIERDRRILALLNENGALTRNDLAELLGEEKVKVYLSLTRLRNDGRVRTCAANGQRGYMLWSTAVDRPCP